MKYGIIIIILGLLIFVRCGKKESSSDDCPKNPFGLSVNTVVFEKDASNEVITATSNWGQIDYVEAQGKKLFNDDFEVACLDGCSGNIINSAGHRLKITGGWFEITELSKKKLSISVTNNETGTERRIDIILKANNCVNGITVTQKAN